METTQDLFSLCLGHDGYPKQTRSVQYLSKDKKEQRTYHDVTNALSNTLTNRMHYNVPGVVHKDWRRQ